MDRSFAVGGVIAAALVVVAMIAVAGTRTPEATSKRSGVEVNAPFADVKTTDDNVRVNTPFVDVDIPKSRSTD